MIFFLFGCSPQQNSLQLTDTKAYAAHEIIVSVNDDISRQQLQNDFGLYELQYLPELGIAILEVDSERDLTDLIVEIKSSDLYEFAEPNYLTFSTSFNTNDPYSEYQWHLNNINIETAWQYNQGQGVTVAVLDTGVNPNGPDGIQNLLEGYDTYNNDTNPTDVNGHGTHVASTIAQRSNNNFGEASVAPMVNILPVKVMSDDGYGDNIALAQGIVYAVNNGADVINMSLGNPYSSQSVERAIKYAAQNGVVMVAATGNSYAGQVYYPAAYPEVIAVGAARFDNSKSGYSNYGSAIDVLAPGGDLSRDDNRDGYADGILQETYENGQWTSPFYEGTSMASPQVAGLAALIIAEGVNDPESVRSIIQATAVNTGPAGFDSYSGYGVVNAGAAVAMAAGNNTPEPSSPTPENTPEPDLDLQISNVSGYIDGEIFTVRWTTTIPASSYLEFEEYGSYGNDELTTDHTLRLRGSEGESYRFSIRSTDEFGFTVKDGPYRIEL